MSFSSKLIELRKEKGIKQKELSTMLNLSANVVCEWEKERSQPNIETLSKIADIFECSLDYLVGRSDEFGNIVVKKEKSMTEKEKEMLDIFRKIPTVYQSQVIEYASYIVDRQKGLSYNKQNR